jgi:hypothetical protein
MLRLYRQMPLQLTAQKAPLFIRLILTHIFLGLPVGRIDTVESVK